MNITYKCGQQNQSQTANGEGWRSEYEQLDFAVFSWDLKVRKMLVGVVDSIPPPGGGARFESGTGD